VRFMPTTGAMYASNRNHDEDSEVDGDKRQAFINHQAMMTSIEPTHVPVHDRIRTSLNMDRGTRRSESGMQRLGLQLANLWRGIAGVCHPSPALPMGGTSSLDRGTERFESGMSRLIPELVGL